MQLGVVYTPLISRQKEVERQWARSTRDQEFSCSFLRFSIAKVAHCKKLAVKDVTSDRQARLEFIAYPGLDRQVSLAAGTVIGLPQSKEIMARLPRFDRGTDACRRIQS